MLIRFAENLWRRLGVALKSTSLNQIDRTSPAFFEAKYQADVDPWNFASSPTEQFRYDRILDALGKHRRYRSALEPACSVGVLTARLAQICDHVVAVDVSPTAVARAVDRCAGLSNVEIHCLSIAEMVPANDVDLLVLSEVGYYFMPERWNSILTALLQGVQPGCTVLAAHWLGHSEDHRTTGDEVHAAIRHHALLSLEAEERHQDFRLDRLVRV